MRYMASSAHIVAGVISEEPESITPRESAEPEDNLRRASSVKHYRTKLGKRLSGRPAPKASNSSLGSLDSLASLSQLDLQDPEGKSDHDKQRLSQNRKKAHHVHHIIGQVHNWLREEKARRTAHQASKDSDSSSHTATSFVDKSMLIPQCTAIHTI